MTDKLRIVDIEISPSRPGAQKSLIEHPPQFVDVSITVKNVSSDKTLHAISSLRSLNYDSGSGTLQVGLSEPAPDPEFIHHRLVPPTLTSIQPGETKVLSVAIPLMIQRIKSPKGARIEIENVDISGLQKVKSTINYSDVPFQLNPETSGREMRAFLHSWGQSVEKTVERKIPKKSARTLRN